MSFGPARLRRVGIGLAILSAASAVAASQPVYFHKPDVDREQFASDYANCEELAGGVNAPPPLPVYTPDIYSMAVGSFFNGFFRSREKRHMIENVLRTCMADKGYRRVRASKETVKALNSLPDKERVDRLFELAAAPVAEGEILPR